jgi:hypothetical protein
VDVTAKMINLDVFVRSVTTSDSTSVNDLVIDLIILVTDALITLKVLFKTFLILADEADK